MMSAPWPQRPLGELVEVLDHKRVPVSAKERAARTGSVPYYGAAGQVGWIDKPLFDEPLLLLGEDGVQFFDNRKPKAYLIDGPSWVNNHAHVLRPRRDVVDRRFLLHYLNVADFHGFANGTTRLKLTKSAMNSMRVPLPPVNEQRRIVEILEDHLSRVDAAIGGLLAAVDRLRALGVVRLEATKRIASTGEIRSLADVAVDAGYGTSTKCVPGGPGPAVVRIPNLIAGNVDLSDEKRVQDPSIDVSSTMLNAGDLLVVRTNGSRDLIGRTAVVQSGVTAAFASYLIRYRVDTSRVRPAWVQLMMQAPSTRSYLESLAASSAGQYNLSLDPWTSRADDLGL